MDKKRKLPTKNETATPQPEQKAVAGAAVKQEMEQQYAVYRTLLMSVLDTALTDRERLLLDDMGQFMFELGYCAGGIGFTKAKNKFTYATELDALAKGLAHDAKVGTEQLNEKVAASKSA